MAHRKSINNTNKKEVIAMTNEELIAKIKAEIERLKSIEYPCDNSQQETGFFNALDRMTDFLDTLESEKGLDVTDFCKPIDPSIAQCIADHSWEMLGEDEKPVPNDLEEADGKRLRRVCNLVEETKEDKPLEERLQELKEIRAEKDLDEAADKYEKKHTYQRYDGGGLTPEYNATLAEAVIFGAKWQKKQMLKEAVEGFIFQSEDYYPKELVARYDGELKHGDKVRIVIVKE